MKKRQVVVGQLEQSELWWDEISMGAEHGAEIEVYEVLARAGSQIHRAPWTIFTEGDILMVCVCSNGASEE